jgi:hypothetical protein
MAYHGIAGSSQKILAKIIGYAAAWGTLAG